VLVVGVCIYLGYLADEKYDWTPAGTLIGFVVGFAAGFYQLVRMLGPAKKVPGGRDQDAAGKDGS